MPRGESLDPIEVRLPCLCAQTHPDGDVVLLDRKIGLQAGHAASRAYRESLATGGNDLEPRLAEALMPHQVISWNFTDPDGKPVDVTPENIAKYLSWVEGGRQVADACIGAWTAAAKLMQAGSADSTEESGDPFSRSSPETSERSSSDGPTVSSTSPKRRSSSKRRSSTASS